MVITSRTIQLQTRGQGDVHDLTPAVAATVAESSLTDGLVTVFVVGSTAGITTIEFEPGAVADLDRAFEARGSRWSWWSPTPVRAAAPSSSSSQAKPRSGSRDVRGLTYLTVS